MPPSPCERCGKNFRDNRTRLQHVNAKGKRRCTPSNVQPQTVNPVSSSNDSQNHTISPVSTVLSQSTSSQQNRPSQTNNNIPEQSTSSHFFKRNPVKKQTLFPENSDSDTSDDTSDDEIIQSSTITHPVEIINFQDSIDFTPQLTQSLNCILPERK